MPAPIIQDGNWSALYHCEYDHKLGSGWHKIEVKLFKDEMTEHEQNCARNNHNNRLLNDLRIAKSEANWHCHVSGSSSDCDGVVDRDYIVKISSIQGITSEYDFKNYMVGSNVSVWNPGCTLTVRTENSVEIWNPNDEGGTSTSLLFCEDADCNPDERSYRDHRAESMGY